MPSDTPSKPWRSRIRDGLRYRTRPLRGWIKHVVFAWPIHLKYRASRARHRLHIGSGTERLAGWVNIDIQKLPEVDLALDVTRGLRPFSNVEAIFAEHFLEHLTVDRALDFLAEAHRALGDDGWLRLSTPNLDWVWQTQYSLAAEGEEKIRLGLLANRSFYGWQHRFLWNRELLVRALAATGFGELRWCLFGESQLEIFRGIERHETYPDSETVPHVLVAEAPKGRFDQVAFADFRQRLERDLLRFR